jgi:hypothetical protein
MRMLLAVVLAVTVIGAAAADAKVSITIDKSTQRMTVSVDGAPLYNWPVSTGRPGHDTPSGAYRAFRMERDHYSKEWDDAPMPHSIFFTQVGHAIHGTYDTKKIGSPASAGCVRLDPENAEILFALVEEQGVLNTTVRIMGDMRIALGRSNTQRAAGEAGQGASSQDARYSRRYREAPRQGYYVEPYRVKSVLVPAAALCTAAPRVLRAPALSTLLPLVTPQAGFFLPAATSHTADKRPVRKKCLDSPAPPESATPKIRLPRKGPSRARPNGPRQARPMSKRRPKPLSRCARFTGMNRSRKRA